MTIKKVVENDMAPTLLIYFTCMGMGQFYIFAAVFAYFSIVMCGLLVLAYHKNNAKLILIFRGALVFFTIMAFLNIFIDNASFTDAGISFLKVSFNLTLNNVTFRT